MSLRIAEEAQLLAEEKWIIEALTKIKKQRNCLQIERLHLESLKAKCMQSTGNECQKSTPVSVHSESTNRTDYSSSQMQPSFGSGTSFKINEYQQPFNGVELSFVEPSYTEELNLAVTKSVFTQEYRAENMEEYEEDDDDTCDNVLIDINMLMNGKCRDN